MADSSRNFRLRKAAGDAIQQLTHEEGETLPWGAIARGFEFEGEKVLFATTAEGIFKPKSLTDEAALSIKSARPSRKGRTAMYDDEEIGDGLFKYKLQGDNFDNHRNRLILNACEQKLPLIYFVGIADALYTAIYPTFIENISEERMEVILSAEPPQGTSNSWIIADPTKRYNDHQAKARVHQAKFRDNVLTAYGSRCAISQLAIPRLLIAAHIIPDKDPRSKPVVENGICLSNLHHTAYDANLLGIDADFRIHIKERLLKTKDGPLLDHGLKGFHGLKLRLPRISSQAPNQDFLAQRFEQFNIKNK